MKIQRNWKKISIYNIRTLKNDILWIESHNVRFYIFILWGSKADEKGLIIDVFSPKGEFLGNFRSGVKPFFSFKKIFLDNSDNLYVLEPLQEPKLYRFSIEYQ